MTSAALMFALALSSAPASEPYSIPPTEKSAESAITAKQISDHIKYLASDKLEGRAPGTPGDLLGRQYIADQFKALGLKPAAADGSWYQSVELIGINGHPKTLTVASPKQTLSLELSKDFMASAGTEKTHTQISNAEIVFVGYGIVAPEYKWDDYKGADLHGKVLLMMNNNPGTEDPKLFAGKTRLWYGRWDYKYLSGAKVGAAGVIIIHTTPSAGYPWQVVQTSWSGEQFELPYSSGPQIQLKAWATEDVSRQIASLGGKDLDALRAAAEKPDFKPVPLGVKLSVDFNTTVKRTQSANVIGSLPGSDPKLASQAVLFTAHHDHLGRKKGAKSGEDDIYNGAVDNASGVAEMLTVARAFKALPTAPRRTLLFAAVAGEEQGLLGSQYLAEHSPIPTANLAADINMDGANIWGATRDVTMVGLGKSSVDAWVLGVAKSQGRVVKPDQFPDRGFFYRSDQFSLAKVGVPAVAAAGGIDFVGRPEGWGREQRETWERTHYHQPSDEFDPKWDLSGAVQDCQLYFHVGAGIANADEMPKWTPGDEFEAARKKATASEHRN